MAKLITDPNLPGQDQAYGEIIEAHRGLSDAESMELNARLILILANHIGDREVLSQALALAQTAKPAQRPISSPRKGED